MKNRLLFLSLVCILILLVAVNDYYSDHLPKAMVNRIIQDSMNGKYSDLNIQSQDQETLQRFFSSEWATDDLGYSGDFTHANPDLPELLYKFQHIEYDDDNNIRHVISGHLAVLMNRESYFKWEIKQVRILNELHLNH
ncbi:hypothetical protein [Paenibacillus tengchongensis]|uniref:hypothetical protein n=1 Tax=Paenibacillus tengchongensis TaxID=2608684 RepID=UPI00124BF864|nr:hypothetical protein [Paenibacillus tengchongensis]